MHSRPPTPSRLADPLARALALAFAEHRAAFGALTRRARERFEAREWRQHRVDATIRLGLYRQAVDGAEASARAILGERANDRVVWVSAKAVYSSLIADRQDWDLAETFFNSVTRRLFSTVGVDPLVEYVASDFDAPPSERLSPAYRRYGAAGALTPLVSRCLRELPLSAPWIDLEGDAALVAARIEAELKRLNASETSAVEVLRPLFFRGKSAYVVGRLVLAAGAVVPLVMVLRHPPAGVRVDAVLLDRDEASQVFSFTRSYFHVDDERPYEVMRFLRSLMPRKPIADLYIALGEVKQGKTELYRALVDHLHDTDERYGFAPGVPGLVMVVLTAPKLDLVLKVIRDVFPPEKDATPARVRERYGWVYTHDRAGRLVDAQEFEHLVFPRERFDPALLEELLTTCSRTVRVQGARVHVDLAYVERKLTPLNLYVRQRSFEQACAALDEYARAIDDLCACNIFPGDLLLKNFGVTRHGRVALYDYDELIELTSVRFRDLPEARRPEEEASAEPFFAIGAQDVFPEEFSRFLGIPERLRRYLVEAHPQIFRARWWRSMQALARTGRIREQAPYPPERRLREPIPHRAAST
jgi:isocitrate dehydrogenase kinase/phosphatase